MEDYLNVPKLHVSDSVSAFSGFDVIGQRTVKSIGPSFILSDLTVSPTLIAHSVLLSVVHSTHYESAILEKKVQAMSI